MTNIDRFKIPDRVKLSDGSGVWPEAPVLPGVTMARCRQRGRLCPRAAARLG
ncbi:hypothetical protein [Streptomyces sp. NPDC005970]|uniref:hypothetical protein n=1 Tax=Streptomyces sp. NPDC005970 TaxID=3156723 RepID=UPI00340D147A